MFKLHKFSYYVITPVYLDGIFNHLLIENAYCSVRAQLLGGVSFSINSPCLAMLDSEVINGIIIITDITAIIDNINPIKVTYWLTELKPDLRNSFVHVMELVAQIKQLRYRSIVLDAILDDKLKPNKLKQFDTVVDLERLYSSILLSCLHHWERKPNMYYSEHDIDKSLVENILKEIKWATGVDIKVKERLYI